MYKLISKFNQNLKKINSINVSLTFLFLFVLFGGIYHITNSSFNFELEEQLRKIFIAFFCFSLFHNINWNKKLLNIFSYFITAWCIIIFLNLLKYIFNNQDCFRVFHMLEQGLASFIIVTFICQNIDRINKVIALFFNNLIFQFFSIFIFLFLIIGSFYSETIIHTLCNGFGDNRVNYSITLSGFIVFILLFFTINKVKVTSKPSLLKFFLILFLVFEILVLIVHSGGRLGILAAFLSLIYFSYKLGKVFLLITVVLLSLFFYHPNFLNMQCNDGIVRNTYRYMPSPVPSNTENLDSSLKVGMRNVYETIDNYTSGRLYMFNKGFVSLDIDHLLQGRGVDRFIVVNKYGDASKVHNLFLSTLGELGIVSFLILCGFATIPFLAKPGLKMHLKMHKFVCFLWTLLAFFQPEILITQIHSSIPYFFSYAYLLNEFLKHNKENN